MAITAPSQIFEVYAANPLTPALTDLVPFQPDDAGATEMGASTFQELILSLGLPLTIKVSLTSSEVLNVFTTNKVLIAAPGAGKFIRLWGASFNLDFNSAAYSGNALRIVIPAGVLTSSTIYTGSSDTFSVSGFLGSIAGDPTDFINQPLKLDTTGGNPTTGNSPLDVYLTYSILSL